MQGFNNSQEAQEGLELPARRFRVPFLRRSGGVALSAAVELGGGNEAWQDDEDALFGLETQLGEYKDLWRQHFGVVSDFVDDDENPELLAQVIRDQIGAEDDRDSRRRLGKIQERDFTQFAAIYVTAGRMLASIRRDAVRDVVVDAEAGLTDAYRAGAGQSGTYKRAESKRSGLLFGLHQSPATQELQRRLSTLESKAHSTYKPIVKKEAEMQKIVDKQLDQGPSTAIKLIETYLASADSELETEQDFAAFLANNYLVGNGGSLLGRALAVVEHSAGEGGLAEGYIETTLAENDGDNALAFFSRSLVEAGVEESFARYMTRRIDSWPSDMRGSYERFASETLSRYRSSIQRSSERKLKKMWLHPDLETYEESIDRLFLKIYPQGYQDRSLLRPKAQSTPARSRLRMSPSDVLTVEPEEEPKVALKLAFLSRTANEGLIIRACDEGTDGVVDRLLDRDLKRDQAVNNDVRSVIENLCMDPHRRGVHALFRVNATSDTGAQQIQLYRAGPRWMGLQVSKRTRDMRVIYSIANDQLVVHSISRNHEEYDRVLESLLKYSR